MSQQKYLCDLLPKTSMSDANVAHTPLVADTFLSLVDGSSQSNAIEYQQVVGNL